MAAVAPDQPRGRSRQSDGDESEDSEEDDGGIFSYFGLPTLFSDMLHTDICVRENNGAKPADPDAKNSDQAADARDPVPDLQVVPRKQVQQEQEQQQEQMRGLRPRPAEVRKDKVSRQPTIVARSPPASTRLDSGTWSWPEWVMDAENPCIEVFVQGEAKDESRWVRAVPQVRVLSKLGHDVFLTAQYEWGNEIYEQDFTPAQVRHTGSAETLEDLFLTGRAKDYHQNHRYEKHAHHIKTSMASFATAFTSTVQQLGEHITHMGGGPIKPSGRKTPDASPVASADDLAGKRPAQPAYRPALPAEGLGDPHIAAALTASSSSGAVPGFVWPEWALQYHEHCIEVYVEDPDARVARWVPAMPKNRVVGPHGEDVFMSAEYDWDGEAYVQEFPPKHVRRPGSMAPLG